MLYSLNGKYPNTLPFRIVLSDGRTRTDQTTFTEEEIDDAGFILVDNPPTLLEHQSLSWNGTEWVVHTKTSEEIQAEIDNATLVQWQTIRQTRDRMMANYDWRYTRYEREVRLGLTPTDDIVQLDAYMQALADITQQEDPYNIVWPDY
jgi:hypothetical protein